VGFLGKLLGGKGAAFRPQLRAALEDEGLILVEEGLSGSVRYKKFRAPGKYFDGKVVPQTMCLAISEERLAVYGHSGRVKLIDSRFDNPRLGMLEVSLQDEGRLAILIDYDKADAPKVSGQLTIVAKSPNAAAIVEELRARLPGGG
jgi:hypothetical protein